MYYDNMYYDKYLKYKSKYNDLIKSIKGGSGSAGSSSEKKPGLPIILHSDLLWLPPYYNSFEDYIKKEYITDSLKTRLTNMNTSTESNTRGLQYVHFIGDFKLDNLKKQL